MSERLTEKELAEIFSGELTKGQLIAEATVLLHEGKIIIRQAEKLAKTNKKNFKRAEKIMLESAGVFKRLRSGEIRNLVEAEKAAEDSGQGDQAGQTKAAAPKPAPGGGVQSNAVAESSAPGQVETAEERKNRLASEIDRAMLVWVRARLEQVLHVGGMLCEAKDVVPHGEWEAWVKARGFALRTASNWMRLYRQYQEDRSALNADLSTTEALRLLTETNVQKAGDGSGKSSAKGGSKPKGGDKEQGSKKPLVEAPTEDALKEAAEKGRLEGVAAAQRALNAEKDRANQAEGDALKKAAAIDSLQKRLEEAEKARAHSSENGAGLDDDAEDLQTLRNQLEGARSEADAERKRRERAEVLNKEKDERIANLKASLSSFDSPEQDALSEDDEALPPKDAYEKALKQDKEQIKKWGGLPLEEAYGKAIGWIKQIRGSQWSEGCRYDLALRDLAIIEGEDVDAIRARYDNVNCNKYPDELRRREAKLKQREANGERPPA